MLYMVENSSTEPIWCNTCIPGVQAMSSLPCWMNFPLFAILISLYILKL